MLITANKPGQIQLIINGRRIHISEWNTKVSYEEYNEGYETGFSNSCPTIRKRVEQTGCIDVQKWITDDEKIMLKNILDSRTKFEVVTDNPKLRHICILLKETVMNDLNTGNQWSRYTYNVMPSSDYGI